ncbi:MAG: MFS transporter [Alphaproteobacteria bacterium]|nr:MAG: MFS transporter [Alphaproteobacteria bacterium]
MAQAAELLTPARTSETKLVAGVCFAHLVSHYYMLMLAPLFAFIRADFGVTYTELSLALTTFNVVSAVSQTPVGFFIDRTGARINLIGGLLLGSAAIAIAGAVHSFWVFIAMFAVLGLANTVYHPADYTLLSERVSPRRMTQVFSFHTCSGMIGSAIAPVSLLFMQSAVGWRGAFLCSALLGVVAALVLAVQGEPPVVHPAHPSKPRGEEPASWQLLLSPPILLNLLFFVVLSMVGGGLNQYLVVGLGALYGTPPGLANTALTGLLTMSAIGVLLGGVLAGRTARHSLVACTGLLVTGAASTLIAFVDPGALLLVLIASLSGFASGMTMPSRDMIVRSVTPPGSFGKVFGFVTTGFHIGGMVAPLIFAQFLDHGYPRGVFLYVAACALVAIATVAFGMSGRRTA